MYIYEIYVHLAMLNKILKEAYHHIAEDTQLIRLVTITTFIHSIVAVLIVIYRLISFANSAQIIDSSDVF